MLGSAIKIILYILLSNIWNIFPSFYERGQHSLPYVSIGLKRVSYNNAVGTAISKYSVELPWQKLAFRILHI
jgi:hypothetical protein